MTSPPESEAAMAEPSEAEPDVDAYGVPFCAEEKCRQYDGKRCRLLGQRPGNICEPAVIAIASARAGAEGKWIAFLREHGERAVVLLRQEDEFRGTDTPLVDTLESLVAEVSP